MNEIFSISNDHGHRHILSQKQKAEQIAKVCQSVENQLEEELRCLNINQLIMKLKKKEDDQII
jgi:hypothetical protein|tara:strand:+ start:223 stop:411 length:189 start_codon:yes stop_codon:yes gene_type:complete